MQPQADVIILTALKEEYDAVLEVSTGARPGSTWETERRDNGQTVSFRSFQGTQGGELRVAVLWAPAMGGPAAVGAIAPLVEAYKPRCLAMCGVCAGRKGAVELGDVIVADVLWDYDQGKAERTVTDSGDTVERVLGRRLSYLLKARWRRRAAEPFSPPDAGPWLKLRPRASQDQPEKPFRVHVGPLATGTKVQRGPGIFERLVQEDYKVLGLEMEAAALAAFAHEHELPHLVMKGVMDFANSAKNDLFKAFAARASAECLVAFLREVLPSGPSIAALPEEAMAAYKRALVEQPSVRYLELQGLANIEPRPRELKLDLLEFAVAPSLHEEDDTAGTRELEIQDELDHGVDDPARKHALLKEREELQDKRWTHHARRGEKYVRPNSLAKALSQHDRLVIVGDPGAGKSLLLRLALLACAEGFPGEEARRLLWEDDPIDSEAHKGLARLRKLLPVRLKLAELGKALEKERSLSLEEFIRRHLHARRATEELLDSLPALLARGRIFLLCDGLDEVAEKLRERVVQEVAGLLEQYPDLRLLLTTRPYGHRPRVPDVKRVRLAPLSSQQQQSLVSRLHLLVETGHHPETAGVARARQRTQALLHAVRTRSEWQTLSSNPLLLTLSALTRADPEGLPRHRVFVFDNFVKTLLKEWRSTVPEEEAHRLMAAWASIASELMRQEQGHGVAKAQLLRMLEDTLGPESASSPEEVLRLALERGLLREEEETFSFWHRTFAEFLAAYALTGVHGRGAARRILAAGPLPLPVLQFAAAQLCHVHKDKAETTTLGAGLLAQDEHREGQLLRPGLRQVSACLSDGVFFAQALVERVWASWAKLLAGSPPSLLWKQFSLLARAATPRTLPAAVVEAFAHLPDRGLYDVRHGSALLVAKLAKVAPSATREACTRWLQPHPTSRSDPRRFYAAFGLASLGEWSEEIIGALGQVSPLREMGMETVARLIRDGGPGLRERLLTLARARLPRDAPSPESPGLSNPPSPDEERVLALRHAAACLLAVAGTWDESVAWVMKGALSGQSSPFQASDLKELIKHGAAAEPVRTSLLEWIGDGSTLGTNAREIVREVAALLDDLPQAVLERAVEAEGEVQERLEELIVSVGRERRSLLDTLWSWLEGPHEPRRLCAARILSKLARHNPRLHEALRRAMQAPESIQRVVWAYQSLYLTPEVSDLALATLQACACSADPTVRKAVYGNPKVHWLLGLEERSRLEGWLSCALSPTATAAARLDAAQFVLPAPGGLEHVKEVLYSLLESEDAEVRYRAARKLLGRVDPDARVAVLSAEGAARTNDLQPLLLSAEKLEPFAAEAVQAILRHLPREKEPEKLEKPWGHSSHWGAFLSKLASKDLSCVAPLLRTLDQRGMAGTTAEEALEKLAQEHGAARAAIGEQLGQVDAGTDARKLRRLVSLGFSSEETTPLAIRAIRGIDPRTLTQAQAAEFARQLESAHAPDEARRLWLSILEGPEAARIIRAATSLVEFFPAESGPWLQDTLSRLLGSPEPSLRVDAARLALLSGVLRERALRTLTDCLELRGLPQKSHWDFFDHLDYIERQTFDSPANLQLLSESLLSSRRIDFVAMRTLCLHRPEQGVKELERWLGDEELERFMCAVASLSALEHSREEVSSALLERVSSSPDRELGTLVRVAQAQGISPSQVLERLLVRLGTTPEPEWPREEISYWLWKYPALWSELRREPPERRRKLRFLLYRDPIVTRDTVALAVAMAFAEQEPWGPQRAENLVTSWCQPLGDGEGPHTRSSPRQEAASPEQVRGWLQAVLLEEAEPRTLETLLCFDRLAEAAGLSLERRLQTLTRAFELPAGYLPEAPEWRLNQQATAALRMLKLGSRHEALLPLLQRALLELRLSMLFGVFPFASALLTSWPEDVRLRELVLHTVIVEGSQLSNEQLLTLLEQARLSSEEQITLLCLCLGLKPHEAPPAYAPSGHPHWREHPASLFAALEQLGCGLERRALLLHEFISAQGMKFPVDAQRALLARPELTMADATKLLVQVLVERNYDEEEQGQQWLARFASKRPSASAPKRWRQYWNPEFLSSRLEWLEEFSQADEPEPVEQALCELTNVDPSLYRQARQRRELSDAQWIQLQEQLALGFEEVHASQFAKEWLLMSLWRTWESPAAV